MNESIKVQPRHLERGAYLYIRQSSMRQVIENVESTKRQYALRGRATALVGGRIRSSSSTAIKVSPAHRHPGAAAFSAW
jgi:hypothetical protein